MMFELAHFYGWTLSYIKTMTIYEADKARLYMQEYNKSQQQGNSQGKR